MKRLVALFFVLLLFCQIFTFSVFAEETHEVLIGCNAVKSDAKGKTLVVYFKNLATEEIIQLPISTIGINHFNDIAPGEYELIKCVHQRNHEVEYPVISEKENLIVNPDGSGVYNFRLGETYTAESEDAVKDLERSDTLAWYLLLAICANLFFLILWIIYAVKGKRNNHKKMIANFYLHIFFALLAFSFAYFAMSGKEDMLFLCFWIATFPAGITLGFKLGLSASYGGPVWERKPGDSSGAIVFVIVVVAMILGPIAFPINFVSDIVKIIKTRKDQY